MAREFLRQGSNGKVFEYLPIGVAYELEGDKVMNCEVHEYIHGGEGYGPYHGKTPMTLRAIRNEDGLHV